MPVPDPRLLQTSSDKATQISLNKYPTSKRPGFSLIAPFLSAIVVEQTSLCQRRSRATTSTYYIQRLCFLERELSSQFLISMPCRNEGKKGRR